MTLLNRFSKLFPGIIVFAFTAIVFLASAQSAFALCDSVWDDTIFPSGGWRQECALISGYVYDSNSGQLVNGVQVRITKLPGTSDTRTAVSGKNLDQTTDFEPGRFLITTEGYYNGDERYKIEVVGVQAPAASYIVSSTAATGYQNNSGQMGWTRNRVTGQDTPFGNANFDNQQLRQSFISTGDSCTDPAAGGYGNAAHRCNFRISNVVPSNTPTPTTAATPNLSLKINADTAASTAGPYGTSRLRQSEGGTNIYNAIRINPIVTNIPAASADLIASGFTDRNSPPTNDTLAELERSVRSGGGFIVLYARNTVGGFTAGNYYVYSQNAGNWGWSGGFTSGTDRTGLSINIPAESQPLAGSPVFSVTILRALTSSATKTWGNHTYVRYNGNSERRIETPPSP